MQVNISTRHGSLSADTREKITEKVGKLRRLYDRVSAIEVKVNLERREAPQIELRLSVERSGSFVARESSTSVMAALDGVIDKIEQQLRKHKDKCRDRRSQSLGRVELPATPDSTES